MAHNKSAASTAWKIIVGVLVTLLVLVLVAEFGLRWFVGNQMKTQLRDNAESDGVVMQADPSVHFGASPLVIGVLSGSIGQITMDVPSTLDISDAGIKGQPATQLEVTDLKLNSQTAGHLVATTTLPDDFLLKTFQDNLREQSGLSVLGDIVVTDITTKEAEDTLEIQLGGGLATLSLVPRATDGKLNIEVTRASLFGMELPAEAAQKISQSLSEGLSEQLAGSDLSIEDVQVEEGTLKITVSGDNVNLSDAQQGAGLPEGQSGHGNSDSHSAQAA